MRLSSFDHSGQFSLADPQTGALREPATDSASWADFDGWHASLGGSHFVLARVDGDLRLYIDGESWLFADLAVTWVQLGSDKAWHSREAVLAIGDRRWRYKNWLKLGPRGASDVTAGDELERFDFGLFLTNLSNDPTRQARVGVPEREA